MTLPLNQNISVWYNWKVYLFAIMFPLVAYGIIGKLRRGIIVTCITFVMLIPLIQPISSAGMYYFLYYYQQHGTFGLIGMLLLPTLAIIIPIIDCIFLIRKK